MSNFTCNRLYYLPLCIVIFYGLILSGLTGSAQKVTKEFTSKHYTVHDGLAQMQVMSLYKDSRGYLWCNTKGGISRFDGKSFKNFTVGIYGLNENDIPTFGEDTSQNLLIFCSKHILRIQGDSVVNYNYPDNYFYSLYNFRAKNCKLLEISTIKKQKLRREILNYEKLDSMFTIKVFQNLGKIIYFDEEDKNLIWQANSDSVFVSDLRSGVIINSFLNPGKINTLFKSGDRLFALSDNSEIYLLNGNSFELVVKTEFNNRYFKVIPTPDNDAFIIKTDKNLYYYKNHLEIIKENLTFIRDILFDDEENLWVATEEGLYNFFQLNFVNYTFGMGNKDWVWSVIEDNDENMWFASYQNGLWKWDGKSTTDYTASINSDFAKYLKDKSALIHYRYYMGASKYDSTLYFPTECNVLKYTNRQFSVVPGLPDEPFQITKTLSDGTLLCGGYPGLFEIKQNGKTRKWHRDSLKVSSILNVEIDKQNNIVAVGKGGVVIIKKDTILNFKQANCLQSYSSVKDHKSNIWIGGIENINLLKDDSIIHVAQKKEEAFYSILYVEPHYLLLGGIKGLYVVDLNNYYENGIFEMILFNQNSGFTGIECGQNGFFTDSEGMVWIPTSDLVTRFDPKKLVKKKIKPPKLFLKSEVSIDNINWHNLNPVLNNLLKNNYHNIRFTTDAVSFANIGNIRYYYQLKGLQENWSEASKTNEVTFYNLSPGKYQFMAKADPGVSNAMSEVVIIDFEIDSPFWLTWWFFVISSVLVICFIFLVVQFFRKRERKKAIIKHRLTQLRSEALSAQLDPHFVMNCLNNISGLVNAGYKQRANDYIVKFSQLLRVILQSVKKESISLSSELEMVKKYMELEQFRCGNCFNYNIVLPEKYSTENILVPPMILQPLVENSIKHGFNGMKPGSAKIEIIIILLKQSLQVSIIDNGSGIQNQTSSGTGLGTKITRERIELLQQKNNIRFKIRNLERGVEVSFEMPLVLKNLKQEFE